MLHRSTSIANLETSSLAFHENKQHTQREKAGGLHGVAVVTWGLVLLFMLCFGIPETIRSGKDCGKLERVPAD